MKATASHIVFKDYNPNQLIFLSPSLKELIDKNHPMRVARQVIEHVDVQPN